MSSRARFGFLLAGFLLFAFVVLTANSWNAAYVPNLGIPRSDAKLAPREHAVGKDALPIPHLQPSARRTPVTPSPRVSALRAPTALKPPRPAQDESESPTFANYFSGSMQQVRGIKVRIRPPDVADLDFMLAEAYGQDWNGQLASATQLVRVQTSESQAALEHLARFGITPSVRSTAIESLARWEAKAPLGVFIESFLHDSSPDVRGYAALLVTRLGKQGVSAVPSLVTALQTDSDAEVRRSAAISIGELGTADHLDVLKSMIYGLPSGENKLLLALRKSVSRIEQRVTASR